MRLLILLVLSGCWLHEELAEERDINLRLEETDLPPDREMRVGVGLGLQVHATLIFDLGLPEGLVIDDTRGTGPSIVREPNRLDRAGQDLGADMTLLKITPAATGTETLHFSSRDTDETNTMSYSAVIPDEIRYQSLDETEPLPPTFSAFQFYRLPLEVTFREQGQRVFGRLPIAVEAPTTLVSYEMQSGSTSGYAFELDAPPASIVRLVPPPPWPPLTVQIVDTLGIARVELVGGTAQPLVIERDRPLRFQLTPRDANDGAIRGFNHDLEIAAITGPLLASEILPGSTGNITVIPTVAGSSTVTFRWGNTTIDVAIDVVEPPM